MSALLVTGIGELVTNDPAHGGLLGLVGDAAVVVPEPPPVRAAPRKSWRRSRTVVMMLLMAVRLSRRLDHYTRPRVLTLTPAQLFE